MQENILYQDSLIKIIEDSIILKNYYFPSMKEKRITFDSIERIEVKEPSIWTGKWRIHGTGNFRNWYPMDSSRYKRDMIFFIRVANKWIIPAFTAEDSVCVLNILKGKGLIF